MYHLLALALPRVFLCCPITALTRQTRQGSTYRLSAYSLIWLCSQSKPSKQKWNDKQGNPCWRVIISTVEHLVLTSSDQLFSYRNYTFLFFFKTTYLNEVNNTESSPFSKGSLGKQINCNSLVSQLLKSELQNLC